MRTRPIVALTVVTFLASGCASSPPVRTESVSLPPLENGWSRIYMSAGKMSGIKLWSVHQVGPIYINDELVGNSAKNEHIVVDLWPGEYKASCAPEAPDKNYTDKRSFTFRAGETRYVACNMEPKGAGMYFGLIGALASTNLTHTYLADEPLDPESRLVAYKKLKSASSQLSQATAQ